jgi:hypothetical protein
MPSLYLIGSLRNPGLPEIAKKLRSAGYDVFDDWFAAGPHADDCWRDYEKNRGHSYADALKGYVARHVFEFDLTHLKDKDGAVLAMPAGKSAHLELGWVLGQGKPGFILLDSPDRWDVMLQLATGVYSTVDDLVAGLARHMPAIKGAA